jgi:hypothetical protein
VGEGRGSAGDGSGASTQERPAIEHELVCSPLWLAPVTLNPSELVALRIRSSRQILRLRVRSGCQPIL